MLDTVVQNLGEILEIHVFKQHHGKEEVNIVTNILWSCSPIGRVLDNESVSILNPDLSLTSFCARWYLKLVS